MTPGRTKQVLLVMVMKASPLIANDVANSRASHYDGGVDDDDKYDHDDDDDGDGKWW